MSSKQELIVKMLEMQQKFSDHVKDGIDMDEYYGEDGFVVDHVAEYQKIADQVNAMAHKEVGSHI